ncbi:hypothetical protein BGW36DRAFT_371655 [Talaromyces proteolyticus]|uniref:Uncharacterized protein n=1 Tax=Talaromyces proteolyticus TaxID=1131652 RepID=A0AAD4KWX8_9EURO|nr:uncharacterized protein BGW36DRAFT_371655 [Talaromyces proteolyticus]KAH8701836.1 hypothetical protein BGW36DRAFT_371655 [Talaromyces proteolyticus]
MSVGLDWSSKSLQLRVLPKYFTDHVRGNKTRSANAALHFVQERYGSELKSTNNVKVYSSVLVTTKIDLSGELPAGGL